jgi:hypothetical protein
LNDGTIGDERRRGAEPRGGRDSAGVSVRRAAGWTVPGNAGSLDRVGTSRTRIDGQTILYGQKTETAGEQ